MDYKGNYFPDDDQEYDKNGEKKSNKAKKIFKTVLYSLSALVYGSVFLLFFRTCEPGMIKQMYFSESAREEAARQPELFEVYAVRTIEFMNTDGSAQLKNIYYSPTVNELEIGITYNSRKLTDGKTSDAWLYVLKDSGGNYYGLVNTESSPRFNYGHERICFGGVALDLENNFTFNAKAEPEKCSVFKLYMYGYSELLAEGMISGPDGVVDIEAVENSDRIFPKVTLLIYDGKTIIEKTNYKK